MKITLFDIDTVGKDIDLSPITALGDCEIYGFTEAEQVKERIINTEIAVINKIKMTKAVIDAAKSLKLICVSATGFDNIDTAYCRSKGIGVANVPAYSTDSVALITVAQVLGLISRLNEYSEFVKSGEYSISGMPNKIYPVFNDLRGKTWGVVGYGSIGKQVASVARAFGCKVIYNKNTPVAEEGYRDIDTLCSESDIITLHCPLNDGTRGVINASRIDKMKNGVVLVNTSRGAVCDERSVADGVISGKIGGFGCDVYSAEPFAESHPYNKIKSLPNVCLTPHMAWASFEARTRVVKEMAENISDFINGKKRNRVE